MTTKKITKLLVANRGEIAIRVFRACNELGIRTVGIYSAEDTYNLFRTKADEAYRVGRGLSPLGAYLDIDGIIKLALSKSVDAIHPGYGFLSENAAFAAACEQAGILFIGPPSTVLNQMGDKLSAKKIASQCNVPTIPGSKTPLIDITDAQSKAEEYGYPVILKAAAGGGGRGMRRVNNATELAAAFELVASEALKSFGSADIFMEKFLVNPKHIEIQVLADAHGNVVHLYERDCSLQRRYQKVIEFAPAFSLSEKTKQALYDDAVKIAKSVDYVSAGTVEFLVDEDGKHYFIEMNPRIQVEHTVSEVVTGIDIVQSQIMVAGGAKLSDPEIGIHSQDDVRMNCAAIQCRVTTEDPANNFSPDIGKITAYRSSGGFGVRLDAGNAYSGAEISPYYDSLLVKVTTFDRSFEGATRKALRAVNEMRVRGVKTNIQFLSNILAHPDFAAGNCHTTFIDDTNELYSFTDVQDRATKILNFIADTTINGKLTTPRGVELPQVPTAPYTLEPGLKQILDQGGPEAFKKYCLDSKKLLLSDTTMRDAHQSLLATRVRTHDLATIADYSAKMMPSLFAMEAWGGATFDVAYRFLHECPWERLALLRERIPNVPLMMLLRGANAVGYTNYPDNLVREFVKQAAETGIDVFRIFDSLNWLPNMELSIEEALKCGKVVEGYICYTGDLSDPKQTKYDLRYYVNMAKELERRGVHILGIKDMAGLLKPYAAHELVTALKNEVGLPIHLHTHDTTGNGVATLLKAAEAGVDIVDVAISSVSSLTSQPSMNAVVAALAGTPRDTGLCDQELQPLVEYWSGVRAMYAPFESDMTYPTTDVYYHQIPGGQYTNLKSQVESVGLKYRFEDVKNMYGVVNRMLGDIVKVTPSSKMVGDFAIFMVQNDLTEDNILEKGAGLNFPDSVVSYFRGMMGQPEGGFPPALQKLVLGNIEPITGRPGALLKDVDFTALNQQVALFCPNATVRDLVSWCLYPKVFEDYSAHKAQYSDVSMLDSLTFFYGLDPGETTEVEIEDGKVLMIKLINADEVDSDGMRHVIFELNGQRREVVIADKNSTVATAAVTLANTADLGQVGASIPGMVSKVMVNLGDAVKAGDVLGVIEAMKMETNITARKDGVVGELLIKVGQTVKNGELLAIVK